MPGEIVDIPAPPRKPVLGHLTEIDQKYPLGSFVHLANKYGEFHGLRKCRLFCDIKVREGLVGAKR